MKNKELQNDLKEEIKRIMVEENLSIVTVARRMRLSAPTLKNFLEGNSISHFKTLCLIEFWVKNKKESKVKGE